MCTDQDLVSSLCLDLFACFLCTLEVSADEIDAASLLCKVLSTGIANPAVGSSDDEPFPKLM